MFHSLIRKGFLVTALTLLLVTMVCSMVFTRASAATTLGASAAASGRTFAAAVANSHLSEAQYVSTLDAEFNGLTPENEMKWDATEPSRGSFNFGAADAIVSHAQSHNMKIRGHTLVWHSQLPGWVSSISSGSDLLTAMRNHITTVATHFQGKITYWDVVNEAFNEDGSRRSSPFQNLIGNSFIEQAFVAARAADPNAKLCYNDFNTENMNAKSNAVFNMVQDFKARGVPIDCVGFQDHLIVGQVASAANLQANMQRFANLGVDVNITELDIRMPTPASSANLQQQASDYQKVVAACLAIPRCTSITTWGVTDKFSWVPGTFSGQGAALLFDENYNKKAAYTSVLNTLNGTTITPVPTTGVTPTATPNRTPTPGVTPTPGTTPTTGTGGPCRVTYTVTNQWPTGFGATLTITNTGSTAINGWSLTFTFANGQTITQLWNGSFTQSGGNVTVTNLSYNSSIAPGATLTSPPGFNGAWNGTTNTNPTSFRLNGATCTS